MLVLVPAPALAGQVVTLVNGNKMEVETYRMEGPRIVFTLSGGGEIGFSPRQVSAITLSSAPPLLPRAGEAEDLSPEVPQPAPAGAPGTPTLTPARISPWDPEPGVRALIAEIAVRVGVDAKLVEALVEAESKFDPYAVSRRGAMGLMQLMPSTARRFQVEDVFDPRQNLEGGMRYLKVLLIRYEDTALALAAYNAGEEVVDRYRGVPPFRETRGYVARILRRLKS